MSRLSDLPLLPVQALGSAAAPPWVWLIRDAVADERLGPSDITESLQDEIEKEHDIEKIEALKEQVDSVNESIADLMSVEYEPDDTTPVLTIGYIPASKLTQLKQQVAAARRMEDGPEKADASTEIDRDAVAWGVKSWRMAGAAGVVECTMGQTKHRGRPADVLTMESVDIIERMGWLASVARAIWDHNSLDEEAKKK